MLRTALLLVTFLPFRQKEGIIRLKLEYYKSSLKGAKMARLESAIAVRSAALNIGRGPSVGPKPGSFESVRLINPTSFPVRGESQTPSFRFEPLRPRQLNALRAARVKPQTLPQPVAEVPRLRPAEATSVPEQTPRVFKRAEPIPIEYQRLANRVRIIQRSILARQGRVAVNPEVSAAASSQVQTGTEQAARAFTQTAVETSNKTKVEAGRLTANKVRTRNGLSKVINRTSAKVYKSRKYKGKDQETNSRRLQVLDKEYQAIKSENPSGDIDGAVLARRSFIGTLESLKSAIFFQRGELNREDGSQRRIELMLGSIRAVDKGKLTEIIAAKTAIKETDVPESVTNEQVNEVFNPPDRPFAHSEPVVVEKLTGNQQEIDSVNVTPVTLSNQSSEKIEERKEQIEERIEEKTEAGLMSPVVPLDSGVDNIDIGLKQREELFKLAA